jgi:hypothetical protein
MVDPTNLMIDYKRICVKYEKFIEPYISQNKRALARIASNEVNVTNSNLFPLLCRHVKKKYIYIYILYPLNYLPIYIFNPMFKK